ncbi:MAG TPA: isoprenylcysteine carboxylmethyltransferase family protein [Candidatus Acidoferrum sp.]|nr:isoprenylcysteine carboxylmethyltransferase family protein [Candidatus Acidoferrum sp.]
MNWGTLNTEQALQMTAVLWYVLALVWLVMWFGMKRAKRSETPWERVQHVVPVLVSFWLLFERQWPLLDLRLLPETPGVLWAGVLVTALGVGIGVWARLSLGTNWSGMVTLKRDHELVRTGLYKRIRHPIYTGILAGFLGTELIKGQVRGLLGFLILWLSFYFKARREENFLRQEFGEGFEEHARHTGMFLPKLT